MWPYGDRLRELRAELGLSLRDVENRGGPGKDTMSLAERGAHKPRAQTLHRIARAFGLSVAELNDLLAHRAPRPTLTYLLNLPSASWQLALDTATQEERESFIKEARETVDREWQRYDGASAEERGAIRARITKILTIETMAVAGPVRRRTANKVLVEHGEK